MVSPTSLISTLPPFKFIEKVVEASSRVNPIIVGPRNHWFDKFDLMKDRGNRVYFHCLTMFTVTDHLFALLMLADYASVCISPRFEIIHFS